ncbi:MAG: lysophospholipid acyltransferase family protein [Victivallaceae bacterium]|nr:lysophospholipid acyltransferase family protein [Victivallaceae bacterium]
MSPYYLFDGDTYDTPANAKKSLLFRLMLGCRWYFYLRNFFIFYRTGELARKGKLTRDEQIRLANGNIRLVEACGGKIHLRGLNNLRAVNGEAVVLIGNHMSMLETALFHAILREHCDFTFVIKAALLKVPFFRHIMVYLQAIPVGRDNPRDDLRAVLNDGKARLDAGRSVVIFPQSTRSEEFDPAKFNSIGVKLARNAGVKVLPFALKTDFQGNGKYLRDMGPIRPEREVWFEFAPARAVEGNGQETMKEIIEFIGERLTYWRSLESTKTRGELK